MRHRGRTVADVLALTVDEALAHFAGDARAHAARSGPLTALGLGYLPLGQPLSTLSGGEAQRLKLARALTEDQAGTLLRPRRAERRAPPADVERTSSTRSTRS